MRRAIAGPRAIGIGIGIGATPLATICAHPHDIPLDAIPTEAGQQYPEEPR